MLSPDTVVLVKGGAEDRLEHVVKKLLADPAVDVVCIATPDRHHAPQAIAAVRAMFAADPPETSRAGPMRP